MAASQHHHHHHHHRRLTAVLALMLQLCVTVMMSSSVAVVDARSSSQISDLKSKISGVEELLEEFRKQLQQDQAYARGGGGGRGGGGAEEGDVCLDAFGAVGERIIRARASIEQGATFLSAPGRVYGWKDCLHACCSEPHCTVAVVQQREATGLGASGRAASAADRDVDRDGLSCYLFNCTYRSKNVCSFAPQPGFSTYSRTTTDSSNATGHVPIIMSSSSSSSSSSSRSNTVNSARRPPDDTLGEEDDDDTVMEDVDEPPRSDAGQDVVIQLPTDWAVLDGRDSVDDHAVGRFEWALVKGDPDISMKVTHPGLLKISGLQRGVYTFQLTVSDNAGQKSSDNVSVTVLAPENQPEVCTGRCSRYQFLCDDGCCIDITYACDGKQQCTDRSDEAFCQHFDGNRKSVTHAANPSRPLSAQTQEVDEGSAKQLQKGPSKTAESIVPPNIPFVPPDRTRLVPPPPPPPAHPQSPGPQDVSHDPCAAPPVVGACKGTFPRWYYDQDAGQCKHFLFGGCQGNHNNFLQEADCVSECIEKSPALNPATVAPTTTKQTDTVAASNGAVSQSQPESDLPISEPYPVKGGHPVPESGAILPLAFGLIITSLLLLMIGCRMRLVRHRTKKTRPLTTEESDYLINGMYL